MANINSIITYNANLSPAQAQIRALTVDIAGLTTAFNTLDKTALKAQRGLTSTLAAEIGQIGGFTSKIVTAHTSVENFGKAIAANRLSMREYFREAFAGYLKQNSMLKQLAAQQVRYQQSVSVPLGAGQQMIVTPTSLAATGNAAALASAKFSIFNELITGGANRLLNFGKNTQWAGRQLMVGFTMPLALFAATTSKTFRDLDIELTRFAKVYGQDLGNSMSDATARMREEVKQLAFDISRTYGIAAKDTAALAADIAATGAEGNKLIASVQQTTRLAVLGEVDRQDAMKATLAMQSAFKMNTDQLTESINFLNAVENQTSTTLVDLAGAIPKVGPVVRSLGGDIKDLSVLLVAMKEGGVPAAEAANALKSGLASLINPTKQASDVAKKYGIDLKGIVEANKGQLLPTIFAMRDALAGLDDLGKSRVIEQIFGKYQFARMSALFDNIGRAGSQTQTVLQLASKNSADLAMIANKEIRTLTESTTVKFQRALEDLKNSLMPIGQTLTETFIPIFQFIGKGLQKAIDFFQALPEPIKNFTKYGVAIAALAGPVIMLVGLFGNLIANGIKFGMMIVRLGARMSGLKVEKFTLLNEDVIAAQRGVEGLTASFVSQETALNRLSKVLSNYAIALRELSRNNPALFVPSAMPEPQRRMPVIRRQHGSTSPERVPGGYGGGDRIPALLEPGESVITKEATAKYWPVISAMNKGTLPGFSTGVEGVRPGYGHKINNPVNNTISTWMYGIPYKFNSGGKVPGNGKGDKVPALLEPGEFVINERASRQYAPILAAMNTGRLQGFAKGRTPEDYAEFTKRWISGFDAILQKIESDLVENVRVTVRKRDREGQWKRSNPVANFGPAGEENGVQLAKGHIIGLGGFMKNLRIDRKAIAWHPELWKNIGMAENALVNEFTQQGDKSVTFQKALEKSLRSTKASQEQIDRIMFAIRNGIMVHDKDIQKYEAALINLQQSGADIPFLAQTLTESKLRSLSSASTKELGTAQSQLSRQFTAIDKRLKAGGLSAAEEKALLEAKARIAKAIIQLEDYFGYIGVKTKEIERIPDKLLATIRQYSRTHSPSEMFDETGKDLVDGLNEGVKSKKKETRKVGEQTAEEFNAGAESVRGRSVTAMAAGSPDTIGKELQKYEKKLLETTARRVRLESDINAIDYEIAQIRKNEKLTSQQKVQEILRLNDLRLKNEAEITRLLGIEQRYQVIVDSAKERLARATSTMAAQAEAQVKQATNPNAPVRMTYSQVGGLQNARMVAAARRIQAGYAKPGDEELLRGYMGGRGSSSTAGQVPDEKGRMGGGGGVGLTNSMFAISTLLSTMTMFGDSTDGATQALSQFSAALMGISSIMMLMPNGAGGKMFGPGGSGLFGLGSLGRSLTEKGLAKVPVPFAPTMAGAAAAKEAGMLGGGARALMGAGSALSMAGGPYGAVALAAVVAITAAVIQYNKSLEEARVRAIAAFADPVKTAEYFGKKIETVADQIKKSNIAAALGNNVSAAIDDGLREAVKQDYAPLIERLQFSTAAGGAKELSNTFNTMLASGLNADEARKSIQAIAEESGVQGAKAFNLAMQQNLFKDMNTKQLIQQLVENMNPASAINKNLKTQLTSDLGILNANANQSRTEVLSKALDYNLGPGMSLDFIKNLDTKPLLKNIEDTVLGANMLTAGLASIGWLPDWLHMFASDEQEALNNQVKMVDQANKDILELSDISSSQLVQITEQLSQSFKAAPEEAIKAFDDLATAARENTAVAFDPTVVQDYIKKLDPLLGETLSRFIGQGQDQAEQERRSQAIMKALTAGVTIQDIWDTIAKNGANYQAAIDAKVNLQVEVQLASNALDKAKQDIIDFAGKELQAELEAGQKRLDKLSQQRERYLKQREKQKQREEDLFTANQDALQTEIDDLGKEQDAITKSTDAYLKSIEAKSKADSYYANQRKTSISALGKLASGDVFGFLQERQTLSDQAQQYSYDTQIQGIQDRRDTELQAIQDTIDKKQELMDLNAKNHEDQMKAFDQETKHHANQLQKQYNEQKAHNEQMKKLIEDIQNGQIQSYQKMSDEFGKTLGKDYQNYVVNEMKKLGVYLQTQVTQGKLTISDAQTQLTSMYNNLYGVSTNAQNKGSGGTFANVQTVTGLPNFTPAPAGVSTPQPTNPDAPLQYPDDTVPTPPNGPSVVTFNGHKFEWDYGRKQWIEALADGGPVGFFAGGRAAKDFSSIGGRVTGPGGPKSDSIPAYLSHGEYVIQASSVSKYGKKLMDTINAGQFADGGIVRAASGFYASSDPMANLRTLGKPLTFYDNSVTNNTTNINSPTTTTTNTTTGPTPFSQSLPYNASQQNAQTVLNAVRLSWPANLQRLAWTIAMRESMGENVGPGSTNFNGVDYGIFQINRPSFGSQPWFDVNRILDPNYNAQVAFQYVSKMGTNFLPWAMVPTNGGAGYAWDWSYYGGTPSWATTWTIPATEAFWNSWIQAANGGLIQRFMIGGMPSGSSYTPRTTYTYTPGAVNPVTPYSYVNIPSSSATPNLTFLDTGYRYPGSTTPDNNYQAHGKYAGKSYTAYAQEAKEYQKGYSGGKKWAANMSRLQNLGYNTTTLFNQWRNLRRWEKQQFLRDLGSTTLPQKVMTSPFKFGPRPQNPMYVSGTPTNPGGYYTASTPVGETQYSYLPQYLGVEDARFPSMNPWIAYNNITRFGYNYAWDGTKWVRLAKVGQGDTGISLSQIGSWFTNDNMYADGGLIKGYMLGGISYNGTYGSQTAPTTNTTYSYTPGAANPISPFNYLRLPAATKTLPTPNLSLAMDSGLRYQGQSIPDNNYQAHGKYANLTYSAYGQDRLDASGSLGYHGGKKWAEAMSKMQNLGLSGTTSFNQWRNLRRWEKQQFLRDLPTKAKVQEQPTPPMYPMLQPPDLARFGQYQPNTNSGWPTIYGHGGRMQHNHIVGNPQNMVWVDRQYLTSSGSGLPTIYGHGGRMPPKNDIWHDLDGIIGKRTAVRPPNWDTISLNRSPLAPLNYTTWDQMNPLIEFLKWMPSWLISNFIGGPGGFADGGIIRAADGVYAESNTKNNSTPRGLTGILNYIHNPQQQTTNTTGTTGTSTTPPPTTTVLGGTAGPNGWPYNPTTATGTIPGTSISLTMNKDVLPLFLAFASDYNKLIRPIQTIGGLESRDGNYSNHPSGTAVDINSSEEGVYFGWGGSGPTESKRAVLDWWQGKPSALAPWSSYSAVPYKTMNDLMNKYQNVLQWFGPTTLGGFITDLWGSSDWMHTQINQTTDPTPQRVAELIGQLGINQNGTFNSTQKYASGGFIKSLKKFATGGKITGAGGPRSDIIPILASNGEYIMNANAVSKYGQGFMDMVNTGKFANGGVVGSPTFSLPSSTDVPMMAGASSTSNSSVNNSSKINITINGAESKNATAIANKVVNMINSANSRRDHSRSI